MGLSKDEEESTVLIKVTAPSEAFLSVSGDQNNVPSKKLTEVNGKVFEFIIKELDDECPNLATKKAFISFDEILKKVQDKKKPPKPQSSFIESNEVVNSKYLAQNKANDNIQEQMRAELALYNAGDGDKAEESEGKPVPDSVTAIKSCRAGLDKKLQIAKDF